MVRILKNIIKDLIDQAWTLLGMFIAWVVLDGSAKTIVGYGIIATTGKLQNVILQNVKLHRLVQKM